MGCVVVLQQSYGERRLPEAGALQPEKYRAGNLRDGRNPNFSLTTGHAASQVEVPTAGPRLHVGEDGTTEAYVTVFYLALFSIFLLALRSSSASGGSNQRTSPSILRRLTGVRASFDITQMSASTAPA